MKRKTEMVLPKRVGLTDEAYEVLRKERQRQKKSMARIVNDLILKEYAKSN